MNSTASWPDWEKDIRPHDKDLADHPWYPQYFKQGGEDPCHPTQVTNNTKDLGSNEEQMVSEAEGQDKDSEDVTCHPAQSSNTLIAQPLTVVSATSTPRDSRCGTCVARGTACTPRPGAPCLQCKARKRKCSHMSQTKRGRRASPPLPASKRVCTHKTGERDPPLIPTGNDGK